MNIFRLEHSTISSLDLPHAPLGPFQTGELYDILHPNDEACDPSCPCEVAYQLGLKVDPDRKWGLEHDYASDALPTDLEEWVFGCESEADLMEWFGDHMETLTAAGWRVRIYVVPLAHVMVGTKQCIFRYAEARPL